MDRSSHVVGMLIHILWSVWITEKIQQLDMKIQRRIPDAVSLNATKEVPV